MGLAGEPSPSGQERQGWRPSPIAVLERAPSVVEKRIWQPVVAEDEEKDAPAEIAVVR